MSLKFKNGRFRIMQIADTQDTNRTSPDTINFIEKAIEKSKPDLIIFSGDQIKGYGVNLTLGNRRDNAKICIDNLLSPVDKFNIPFTFVFGNHDDQAFSISKKEQFDIYKSHKNCLAFNWDDSIEGYCNHNLLVEDENDKPKMNIYLIDSLTSTPDGTVEAVTEGQLNYYKNIRESLKDESGNYIPSILFQHIPVPEIYELLMEVPKGTRGSARGYREHNGKYYGLNPQLVEISNRSFVGETPSIPDINGGEFDCINEKGDIFAAFFGHDHNNSFVGTYKGMKLGYTQGCGFNVYGPGKNRGVRIFDFEEENPRDFETTTITVEDLDGFNIENKLKYCLYTYSPSSVDSVKPYLKGGAFALAGLTAAGIIYKIIKK